MLRGTTILISEDFPKKVIEKRQQLIKFAKEVRMRKIIWRWNEQHCLMKLRLLTFLIYSIKHVVSVFTISLEECFEHIL